MEFSQDIKDSIKNNMLHITTVMKKKPRNYLNKQLQDAVCNYFLENYAAPFLKEEYEIVSGRELRKKIEKALPSQGKKYINLLNKFKSEIQRVQKGEEYRQMLSSMVAEDEKFNFETEEWCTLQRKKILALLLIVHWDEENILNFYDMWNSLYPTDPLIKQKLSKEEKEKQKKQVKNATSSSSHVNSSSSTMTMVSSSGSSNSLRNNGSNQSYTTADCYNRMSYSCDSYSQESSMINSKRSSTSYIAQSCDISYTSQPVYIQQQQPQVVYVQQQQQEQYFQQQQQQQLPKKIINNRIFEDEQEEEQQQQDFHFNVKIEYPQTKIRVCETVDIMPRMYNQQQQQQQYQYFPQQQQQQQYNFCAVTAQQPIYTSEQPVFYAENNNCQQQQVQNYEPLNQQNFKVECASSESESFDNRSESCSSFKNSQILMGTSQMCISNGSEDSYSLKNECSNDEYSLQEDSELFNNNNAFAPAFPVFMNENINLMENTLFSFLNF